MSAFDVAFAKLLGSEGGYSNNPADPGGETMWGITKRVAQQYGYTGDMKLLTQEQAKAIAKKGYWDPFRCDEMPLAVAFQVFDVAYNGGRAAKWLQTACGVEADGVIGLNTLAAAAAVDPWEFLCKFNSLRIGYYTDLGAWQTFGKGWSRRIANNLLLGTLQQ